ncbi:MAG: SLC13 family permease [Planctomycetes bacterium]|nr:SLC13 family permease [Planctomycetota bacterium]
MTLRTLSTLGGLALAGVAYWLTWRIGLSSAQSWTAAVTVLCTAWWVSEALPSAATAMVPLVVFPFAGVLKEREVAAAYGDPVILLFMGAFMVSKAVEHWGAHRRLAHAMMARIGSTSGPRILLALMLTTTLCSFWINNTAIALMMLPVALAALEHDKSGKLAVPLLLGVGYCASIGGIATPIGTAPNGVFQFNYKEITGHTIPFHQWIIVGTIAAMLMMGAAWVVLSWSIRGISSIHIQSTDQWTPAQIRTLVVFGLAALAWITREVPFGGWSRWLPQIDGHAAVGDMTVAVTAALILFLLPSGEKDGSRLLDWKTAVTIPWGVLILFGGGIAIAAAFESSGLSQVIGRTVTGIQDWPTIALIAVLCLVTTFLSEVTSNTATANILMPILGAAAVTNGMDPALLMFPATLANSLAFMMPVGTPPNAIVYGTGKVRIIDMVRYGFVLNLIGVVIVTLVCWLLLPLVFGVGTTIG